MKRPPFLIRFILDCWPIVLPLTVITILTTVLFFTGHVRLAQIFSNLASPLAMLCVLGYVVFHHSKKRWPALTTFQRFVRIVTFERL